MKYIKYFIAVLLIIGGISIVSLVNVDQTNTTAQYNSLPKVQDQKPELSWKQNETSLSLLNHGETVWRFNYDKSEDKPYFYPLRTLNGINLALERPDDHPWHRGLWFSWRMINGINYWEEDPEKGLSPGRTKIMDVKPQLNKDYSASISLEIEYAQEGKPAVLHERRKLTISAPNNEGEYTIDWLLEFTANNKTVILDQEDYAGLGYRADDLELESIEYLDSNNWRNDMDLTAHREKAKWMDLSGISRFKNKAAGLAMFDHPSNPRHPSPWYIWYQKGKNAYFVPAFLYKKPYHIQAGKSFTLQYRVLVHQEKGKFDELQAKYREYIQL